MRRKIILSLLVGLGLVIPLTALSYLADQAFGIGFIPFAIFNWMTPLIPGPIITFGIDAMIDTLLFLRIDVANSAKTAEQGMALMMFIGAGTVLTAFSWYLLSASRRIAGWLVAAAFALFAIAISRGDGGFVAVVGQAVLLSLWLAALGWAAAMGSRLHADSLEEPGEPQSEGEQRSVEQISRRQFLITLGTSAAAITVVGAGVGVFLGRDDEETSRPSTSGPSSGEPLPNAGDPVAPAPGTRPEYTPIQDHYKVFLELEPTVIEAAGYTLPVIGLVDNPLMLSVDELYNRYESFDQYVTLSCISGRVGTTLISTTKWTGISMQDILADAGVQSEAKYLYIESADGFYETVPLELIDSDRRIMLCHSWDDQPIPTDHGFPCRIWIPDRFGMKQPKWIVKMELMDEYIEGYWVERGWSETAQVKATSVIDTVAVDETGIVDGQRTVPVGGIAWAGDRQISRVEVRVDGGEWREARLRTPLSGTTWVIWRYDWPFDEGDHVFEVRCFEGDGTPQIAESSPARPDGATGIDSYEAEVA